MYRALKGASKALKPMEYLGCSALELREHLEDQFTDGMTWENYGEWEIDHVRPCASFDFTKEEDIHACFHFTNTQPLWRADNRRKKDKWEPDNSTQAV